LQPIGHNKDQKKNKIKIVDYLKDYFVIPKDIIKKEHSVEKDCEKIITKVSIKLELDKPKTIKPSPGILITPKGINNNINVFSLKNKIQPISIEDKNKYITPQKSSINLKPIHFYSIKDIHKALSTKKV
jgi:hypothetical protein